MTYYREQLAQAEEELARIRKVAQGWCAHSRAIVDAERKVECLRAIVREMDSIQGI